MRKTLRRLLLAIALVIALAVILPLAYIEGDCRPAEGTASAATPATTLPVIDDKGYRRKLDNTDFETAKAEILAETIQSEKREQPTACPQDFTRKRALSFAEQLERVANGARLITVQPLRRADADMTYGGVASYGE